MPAQALIMSPLQKAQVFTQRRKAAKILLIFFAPLRLGV
jgi:hypothetical protein